MRYVFQLKSVRKYRFPTHTNELVLDRKDARTSEVFVTVLASGEAPPLHKHDDTEQIFYVLGGTGSLQIGKKRKSWRVGPGDVIRIPPHTLHRIICTSRKPLRYLVVDCFVNGRPLAEPTWDRHVSVVCKNNGWNFKDVRGTQRKSSRSR